MRPKQHLSPLDRNTKRKSEFKDNTISKNKIPETPDCFLYTLKLISPWISSTCCRREEKRICSSCRGGVKTNCAAKSIKYEQKIKHVTQVDRQMLEVCAARKHQNKVAPRSLQCVRTKPPLSNADTKTTKGESDTLISTKTGNIRPCRPQCRMNRFYFLASSCEPTIHLAFLHSQGIRWKTFVFVARSIEGSDISNAKRQHNESYYLVDCIFGGKRTRQMVYGTEAAFSSRRAKKPQPMTLDHVITIWNVDMEYSQL